MKYVRNFVFALCASIAAFGFVSCDPDPDREIIIESTSISGSVSVSVSIYDFGKDGIAEREMIVGDSVTLPDGSWKSDNEAVATVVEDGTESWLKAVGVGMATVSDENAELKIIVTVKEREQ